MKKTEVYGRANTTPNVLEAYGFDQVHVAVETSVSHVFHVHINDEIGDAAYYRSLQTILGNAGPEDFVIFHLNSPGGALYTAIQIIGWIKTTEATTVAVLEGMVASAAGIIMLACEQVVAMPHCSFMAHAASFGAYGDMQQIKKNVEFTDKQIKTILYDFYSGFLSEEEISDMINNSKEFWFTAQEVVDRLNERDKDSEDVENIEVLLETIAAAPQEVVQKKIAKKRVTKTKEKN